MPTRDQGITRGGFLTRTAGTVGALTGLGALAPGVARAANTSPKPIPGGLHLADLGLPVPPFPEIVHVEAPGVATLADSEPITITDFNGNIGYAIVDGAGTGRNTATGETKRYSFNVDMRFMQGVYVAEDGRVRHGTFGFVWLDVYDSPVGAFENQIHDYNPGIAANGVFWTIAMPDSAVDVAPGAGRASYRARDLPMPDYHDFVNSIYPATSEPAVVSFDIRWEEIQERTNRRNTTDDFAGEFVVTKATAEWSSRQAGFEFQSDPAAMSVSEHAIVGHERNGVFF